MGLRYLEVGLQIWRHHYFQEIELNNNALQQEKKNGNRKTGSFIIVFNWHLTEDKTILQKNVNRIFELSLKSIEIHC
jgi:hypothetical protein